LGSSKSSFDKLLSEMVNSSARNALLKLLADHEWVEIRARDEACLFVQDLWANSKLQTLDMDVSDFSDRSQLQNNDAQSLVRSFVAQYKFEQLDDFLGFAMQFPQRAGSNRG
jgi:hypothetical protein